MYSKSLIPTLIPSDLKKALTIQKAVKTSDNLYQHNSDFEHNIQKSNQLVADFKKILTLNNSNMKQDYKEYVKPLKDIQNKIFELAHYYLNYNYKRHDLYFDFLDIFTDVCFLHNSFIQPKNIKAYRVHYKNVNSYYWRSATFWYKGYGYYLETSPQLTMNGYIIIHPNQFGYQLPSNKHFHDYDDFLNCHGSITFTDKDPKTKDLTIGMDTLHAGDFSPTNCLTLTQSEFNNYTEHYKELADIPSATIWTDQMVIKQCKIIINQLVDYQKMLHFRNEYRKFNQHFYGNPDYLN